MILYDDFITGDKFLDIEFFGCKSKIDYISRLPSSCSRILTHNGDLPVTDDALRLFHNLTSWFGQNIMTIDSRCIALPIGLENDYVEGSIDKKKLLFAYMQKHQVPSRLAYLNCNTKTYKADREDAYSKIKNCTKVMHRTISNEQYYSDILDHDFIICPRGNGLDCHRNWEVLYLNRYPVMKRYHGLELVYKDLPVVFVDDWEEVTEDLLNKKKNEFFSTTFNKEKLKFSWWKDLIINQII